MKIYIILTVLLYILGLLHDIYTLSTQDTWPRQFKRTLGTQVGGMFIVFVLIVIGIDVLLVTSNSK